MCQSKDSIALRISPAPLGEEGQRRTDCLFKECRWHCKDSGLDAGAGDSSAALLRTHIRPRTHTHTRARPALSPPQPSLWMMSVKLIAVPFPWHAWGGFTEARTVQGPEKADFKGQPDVCACLKERVLFAALTAFRENRLNVIIQEKNIKITSFLVTEEN